MSDAEAAVAILVAADESVLLMRRAERQGDSWSGQWSFPGGRRDAQDVDLLQTALRELEEECGIRLRREELSCALPARFARRREGPFLLVSPFVFRLEKELATILHPLEAAAAAWIPLTLLRDPARHRLRPVPGVPPEFLYPAVDLDVAPLWGFTYRLMTDWLGMTDARDDAGREAAQRVLEFLLACGLTLRQEWQDGVCAVEGAIPVERVVARFTTPEPFVMAVNRMEVHPDAIHLAGPKLEEYVIRCVG